MANIEAAVQFALKAHHGQKRKKSNEPYFNHVQRVANAVSSNGVDSVMAALLHDTVEDCGIQSLEIFDKFGPGVGSLVNCLTRITRENYFDFIARVSSNPDASLIKIADIEDNMRGLEEGSLKDKYRFALNLLKKNQEYR